MDNKKIVCEKGYHYHPGHPKANKDGCMKDQDMGTDVKENYGSLSIYNTVRCYKDSLNNKSSFIGV